MTLLHPYVAGQEHVGKVMAGPAELQLGEVAAHVLRKLLDYGPDADEEVRGGIGRQGSIAHLPEQAVAGHAVLQRPHFSDDALNPDGVACEVLQIAGSLPGTCHWCLP